MGNPADNIIDIVMTMDDHYFLQTRVAIYSMVAASSPAYCYAVHILCGRQLKTESREKIYGLEALFHNVRIEFIEVDEDIFRDTVVTSFYTVASYYRLVMTEVIDGDKCIFLDGDMVVRTDFAELYRTDVEGYYIAGVPDCGMQARPEDFEWHRRVIDLPTMGGYVNAGVLIWNLKKMREDGLYREFLKHIGKGYPSMDNDVLNKCCYGKIKFLDLKYNLFAEFYRRTDRLKNSVFTEEEVEGLREDDMVFHFSGRFKPWEYIRANASGIWWEEAKKAMAPDDYMGLRVPACRMERQSDWSFLAEECKRKENVIIVGFSEIGKRVVDALFRSGIKGIRCFCDNDAKKQGLGYMGLEAISVGNAKEKYPQALWVVTSQNYYKQIIGQLVQLGIGGDEIIRYLDKSRAYYEMVDDRYMEKEHEELKWKEQGYI